MAGVTVPASMHSGGEQDEADKRGDACTDHHRQP